MTLKEFPPSQATSEPTRRWFVGEDIELIVWLADNDAISGFQLCYRHAGSQFALTWTPEHGFRHDRVDEGEAAPEKNQTPILVTDGAVDADALRRLFTRTSADIERAIRDFVLEKLRLLSSLA